MPFSIRNAADNFQTHVLYTWAGAAWTDDDDQWWIWDGATWQLIQPVPAGGLVSPVENLRLDPAWADNPTSTAARVTWTMPAASSLPATEVWVRDSTVTSVWDRYTVPLTVRELFGLVPNTVHIVDVMLVNIAGLVVTQSSIKSLAFTTDNFAPGPPVVTPGTPTSTDIPLPPLPPTAPLPPGTPGTANTCWIQWKLEAGQPEIGWVQVATGEAASSSTISFPTLTPGEVYRLCTRPKCANGYLGTYDCGAAWLEPTTWVNPCADHVDPRYGAAPYLDAVWVVPLVCTPDTIKEKVAGTVLNKGVIYGGLDDGPYAGSIRLLAGAALTGGDVANGDVAATATVKAGSFTLATWTRATSIMGLGDKFVVLDNDGYWLGLKGTNVGNVAWAAFLRPDTGALVELQGSVALGSNLDHHIAITWNNAAKVAVLYANGVVQAVDSLTYVADGAGVSVTARATGALTGEIRVAYGNGVPVPAVGSYAVDGNTDIFVRVAQSATGVTPVNTLNRGIGFNLTSPYVVTKPKAGIVVLAYTFTGINPFSTAYLGVWTHVWNVTAFQAGSAWLRLGDSLGITRTIVDPRSAAVLPPTEWRYTNPYPAVGSLPQWPTSWFTGGDGPGGL